MRRTFRSTAAESGLLNGHNMESAEVNGCVTLFDGIYRICMVHITGCPAVLVSLRFPSVLPSPTFGGFSFRFPSFS